MAGINHPSKSSNWYRKTLITEAQSLDDFASGVAEKVVQEQLQRNPNTQNLTEEEYNTQFQSLFLKRLLKAIKSELKVNVVIDQQDPDLISKLQTVLQARQQIAEIFLVLLLKFS